METHILFFILAGTLIAILVCYSLWSARREKSRIDTFSVRPASSPVGSHQSTTEPLAAPPAGFNAQSPQLQEVENSEQWASQQQEIEHQVQEIKIKLADQTEIAPEPVSTYSADPKPQFEATAEPESVLTSQPPQTAFTNNLVTLYVVAPQGTEFSGLAVVQQLEALGLQHGEYQIFHRHLDNSNSPILFSVANMLQPGIFELSEIAQFTTVGLVFFMQLPSPTNDVTNLRMMINTVEAFSQAVGGFILNEQHQLFDEASRQDYFSRLTTQ